MKRLIWLLALAGCGNADIVAPEPLAIVDTSPGSGSLVPAGEMPIVILFSTAVQESSLGGAVTLDQTTPAGAPVASIPLLFEAYDPDGLRARYRAASLAPSAYFELTVKKEVLRAASGAVLRADFTRAFRTAAP